MSYSKTELIESYKNLDIVAPDNIADSVLLSATKQTPANLSTKVPPTGQLNSHLKKRVSNNQKKQKTPSKPDWDTHSGWASRFKKSDDLFNKVGISYRGYTALTHHSALLKNPLRVLTPQASTTAIRNHRLRKKTAQRLSLQFSVVWHSMLTMNSLRS